MSALWKATCRLMRKRSRNCGIADSKPAVLLAARLQNQFPVTDFNCADSPSILIFGEIILQPPGSKFPIQEIGWQLLVIDRDVGQSRICDVFRALGLDSDVPVKIVTRSTYKFAERNTHLQAQTIACNRSEHFPAH